MYTDVGGTSLQKALLTVNGKDTNVMITANWRPNCTKYFLPHYSVECTVCFVVTF